MVGPDTELCRELEQNPLTMVDIVQSYSSISGGVKRYIHDKIKFFASCPWARNVLIIPGKEDRCSVVKGTTIHEVKSPYLPGTKSYRVLLDGSRIRDIVGNEVPQVMEVDNAYWPAWVAVEIGEEQDIPVVGYYHSDYPRAFGLEVGAMIGLETVKGLVTGAIENYLARLYNRMTVTVAATRHFASILQDMGVERVARAPLGTDTEIFRPRDSREEVRQRLGLAPETFLLLFVGRFAAMKNLPSLFGMMEVLEGRRKCHLLLVGDGEEADKVEKAARERDDVTLWPYAEQRDQLTRYYSAADLFVNAGTSETFGLVSLEAQACGTRVLGVKGGGMDETLEDEEPLVMADSEYPHDLANAVEEVMDLGEGKEERHRRRQRIERTFSLDACFSRMARLYLALREGKRPTGDLATGE